MTNLIDKELIFISSLNSKEMVFQRIHKILFERGYVKENFLDMLTEREKNYPTGLDMNPVGSIEYNIAVPHTESNCVNVSKIIPIKLENEIVFNNMIEPDKEIKVKFLFMILNKDANEQANLLAQIMDFMTKTEDINELFKLESEEEIYEFIEKNF